MLQKQSISVNFAKGLDQKTDPWQVPIGSFVRLRNQVFEKGGRLTKRNGFGPLSALPTGGYSYLTTFAQNLTAIGPSIAAFNESNKTWPTKGTLAPMEVSTLPLIRNSVGQTQCDSAVSTNGLVCTVYTQVSGPTISYLYVVADSVTGQNIISPSAIPVASGVVTGSPRVFNLGNYFIIVFTNVISATSHLQYVAVSTANPANVTANTDIASAYTPAPTVAWDGVVVGQQLFLAYNTTAGGQSIKVTYLTSTLLLSAAATFTGATDIATMMTLAADVTSPANPIIYVSFYASSSSNGYTLAVSQSLATILAPTKSISSVTVLNLASAARNGICTLFYEEAHSYGYDSTIPTNVIDGITVTQGGTVGAPYPVARSVGLASKAFAVAGVIYFLAAFQSPYQNTYFLINATESTQNSPVVAAKLAYGNGGGYLPLGLPGVTVTGSTVQFSYLFKDLIEAQAPSAIESINLKNPPVYTQTGVNLATLVLGADVATAETGSNLLIGGGFLWAYDGYLPVEHNFFLWPDSLEVSISTASVTPTGTVTTGSNVITAVSSTAGVGLGMAVSATGVPASQFVTAFTATTITFGPGVASGSHSAEPITLQGNIGPQPDGATNTNAYYYQAIYEWTDNQGNSHKSAPSVPVAVTTTGTTKTGTYLFTVNVPTLRLTYKIGNPLKIRLYRWSVANQEYFEVTSITMPTLNSTTVDYVTIVDALNDTSIVGNNIIYTTGGVVEDVNAPASNIMTLFDTRFWMVDAEDQNLLWFSKQVIEAVPVEMSDLLTYYVPPSQAAQGSTGPMRALAPMDDKLIIFKENAIYYINGTGPDNTGQNSQYSAPIFVTATVGCSNQQSIVFTPAGLMFQSSKGIWLLGRDLSTQYIGAPVEDFNGSVVQSAVNVPQTNQVRFTLETGEQLMYDYYFQQWGTFQGASAISSCVYDGFHTLINADGTVLQETPGLYLDNFEPVLIGFTSGWIQIGVLQGFQRFYSFFFLGEFLSPHKLNVQVAYNFVSSIVHNSIIAPRNFSSAVPSAFGDQPAPFGSPTSLEQWRIFAKLQKCQSFQITVDEIYDPSSGVPAGAGLTLSGINMTVAIKKGVRPIRAANTVG